jgi:hypothetical protein
MTGHKDNIAKRPWNPNYARTILVTSTVVSLLGGVALAARNSNPTFPEPLHSCRSPFAVSEEYRAPDTSLRWNTQTGINTPGVVITGHLPISAYGFEVSYKGPDEDNEALQARASQMLKTDADGYFAAKLAIGPGAVNFAVRVIAPIDSLLCNERPQIDVVQLDAAQYFATAGELPYANGVNDIVNLFGILPPPGK